MFTHETTYRVCYADTDQMGYMYYGNYARLYEIGRTEAIRSLNFAYKRMEESGVMMPVYEMKNRYIAPARYDDLLTIKTSVKQKPAARIVFSVQVYNEQNTLLNEGEVTLVFVNMTTNRLCQAPQELKDILSAYCE
jgi:acyl-CoA thioester hydrolase